MSEKLCVFCVHMNWGLYGMNDYYEGDVLQGGHLKCGKGHWHFQRDRYDMKHIDDPDDGISFPKSKLADAIQKAKSCPDYEPPDSSPSQFTQPKEKP